MIAAAQLVQQFLTSKNFKYSKNPPSTGGKDVDENLDVYKRQLEKLLELIKKADVEKNKQDSK